MRARDKANNCYMPTDSQSLLDTMLPPAVEPCASRTTQALAELFGITPMGMGKILAREGCPKALANGTYPVQLIRDFMEANGLGNSRKPSSEKQEWEIEILKQRHEALAKQNAYKDGLLCTRKEAVETVVRAIVAQRAILERKFENETPPLYSTDAPANQLLNRKALAEAFSELSQGVWPLVTNPRAKAGEELAIFDAVIAEMRAHVVAAMPAADKRIVEDAPEMGMGRPLGS